MSRLPLDPKTNVDPLSAVWVAQQVRRVLADHQALTIEGWDELTAPSRYAPEQFVELRRQLVRTEGLRQVQATLLFLTFTKLPEYTPAIELVHGAKRLVGGEISLGAAIAAAVAVGYTPLQDNVGPGCGFVRRKP
jgi:hypothetical protein